MNRNPIIYAGVVLYAYIARLAVFIIQLLGKGSGTSLIGYIFEVHVPQFIPYLYSGYRNTIFITGTNGKTTTRSLLVAMYEHEGYKVCTNTGGANIMRGIVAALLGNLNWKCKATKDTLILEVEEATLPKLTKHIKPNTIIFTNIFRDQLDVYGEIDTTLSYFSQAVNSCECDIVINADDAKLLSFLSDVTNPHNIHTFSLSTAATRENMKYEEYSKNTSYTPKSEVIITSSSVEQFTQQFTFTHSNQDTPIEAGTNLLGTYNMYNCAAAISASLLELPTSALSALTNTAPVFGRGEKITVDSTDIWLFLTKNPAGMNQTLSVINESFNNENSAICFLLNDRIADGKDVSWIWDCDFEKTAAQLSQMKTYTAGERAYDAALRLDHAGYDIEDNTVFQSNIQAFVKNIVESDLNSCICIASYTAMREFREELGVYTDVSDLSSQGN